MPEITVNDHTFFYRERGAGAMALFVHGFPLDSTMWLEQFDALSDVRRCVAPDLRGFGRSAPTLQSVLTMEAHAVDLIAMLDELGVDRVDLVGLSMGGYVALALAEQSPDRIRTLALVDTKSTADGDLARAGRTDAARRVAAEGRSRLASEMIDVLVAGAAPAWTRARVRSMIEATPAETIVAALEGIKQRPDRTSALSGLSMPVGVIVGEHDILAPLPEADRMASAAGAALTVVAGAGHMAPIEDPQSVAKTLRALWSKGRPD